MNVRKLFRRCIPRVTAAILASGTLPALAGSQQADADKLIAAFSTANIEACFARLGEENGILPNPRLWAGKVLVTQAAAAHELVCGRGHVSSATGMMARKAEEVCIVGKAGRNDKNSLPSVGLILGEKTLEWSSSVDSFTRQALGRELRGDPHNKMVFYIALQTARARGECFGPRI